MDNFSFIFEIGITIVVATTPLHQLLRLENINYVSWLICIGLCILMLPIAELYKLVANKFLKKINKKLKLLCLLVKM
jgi:ACR3 family arsenite efflux pump ArsB